MPAANGPVDVLRQSVGGTRWARNSAAPRGNWRGTRWCFSGWGAQQGALLAAGYFPATPTWAFALGGTAVGAPLMVLGGRIDSRGRARVLGLAPVRAAREDREGTALLTLYLGFFGLHGALATAPLWARAAGLADPSDAFVRAWLGASMLGLCAVRAWVSRPLWRAVGRRARARWAAREWPAAVSGACPSRPLPPRRVPELRDPLDPREA